MSNWIIGLIQVAAGAAITFLVQQLSSRETRWKVIEERKSDYARRRDPLYAKALEFIYTIEGSQTKPEVLERLLGDLTEWLLANASYFSPAAKKILFSLRTYLLVYFVDLSNRDRDKETVKNFRETLEAAKEFFLNSKDIAWLPEELSQEKKKGSAKQKRPND
jgi:hypothetical protein